MREARVAARLSQDELGQQLALDRTMIAKIEAGRRRLDALELIKLSTALGVPVDHFLREPPQVMSRRARVAGDYVTDAAQDQYRLEATLQAWLRDVRQLIELDVLQPPPVLRYQGKVQDKAGAREAARWLRDQLGIGTEPIGTLMEVCERAGQLVLVTELPGDGASLVDGDVAVAVVSKSGDPGRRRATGAHELGHLVLADEYSTDLGISTSRDDREAVIDAFAAELLLPTAVVAQAHVTREKLIHLAATYRTSWSTAIHQAVHAECLDRQVATRLRQNNPTHAEIMDALGWAPQPDLESVRVPPSYARGAMRAWRQNKLTWPRLVEMMHGQLTDEDLPPAEPDAEVEP
ncbi:Zn-dependent peptidase ImmA (M78 family)/DNA-binding XRE family transcriptional regulator [Kutzneria viridogrisea]|uniref:Zn-dependent peptidase ImmA (M78 family)/DNA-binding XRE family transcriptional regulator n=1 Tax=Kutzneria viridogrisea TaxID=47990 RepID=A0ABR6BQF0_9PSEU|nr:XRE family transcriptional regulator [Kutzneria albida]MBA8928866.1 Zn-dependent peptidase ImmA (M78 family)/DNA-binding XRE family transcriptional regulator [Kutzneria viridogrisea]